MPSILNSGSIQRLISLKIISWRKLESRIARKDWNSVSIFSCISSIQITEDYLLLFTVKSYERFIREAIIREIGQNMDYRVLLSFQWGFVGLIRFQRGFMVSELNFRVKFRSLGTSGVWKRLCRNLYRLLTILDLDRSIGQSLKMTF